MPKFRLTILVVVAYLLLTVIATFPLITQFSTHVTDDGDPFFIAWVLNHEKNILQSGDLLNFFNAPIFAPYQNTLAYSDHSLTLFVQTLPAIIASSNQIVWVNFLTLSGLFLSSLAGYLLAKFYTKNTLASFLSGAIIGFGAYHLSIVKHLQISNFQYLILTILALELLLQKQTAKRAIFFGVMFILNAFVSVYLLTFSLVACATILSIRLIQRRGALSRAYLAKLFMILIAPGILVLITLLPYLQVSRELGISRDLGEATYMSANPRDYLFTTSTHLLLGGISDKHKSADPIRIWNEFSLFMGVSLYVALIAALGMLWRGRKRLNYDLVVYSTMGILAILLTFGPKFRGIALPYSVLYYILPIMQGIRVPSRFGTLTLIALGVLLAIILAKALAKLPTKWRNFAFIVVATIILIEQISFPIQTLKPREINTELYAWTKTNLPADAVVLHYPLEYTIDYMRGQQIDPRPMVNGYSGIMPKELEAKFKELRENPEKLVQVAKDLGIKYIILYGDTLDTTELPTTIIAHKGNSTVFRAPE